MNLTVKPRTGVQSEVMVPGDKSISHRSVMLGAIARGQTRIKNFLPAADCLSSLSCMEQLGARIDRVSATEMVINGQGLDSLSEPKDILNVGNSGTTIRLLTGLLAGQEFVSWLTGDESIRQRPMARVTDPLKEMGASIWGRQGGRYAPLAIKGSSLTGRHHTIPVASAQVKSALLLAGLYAGGETAVTEPAASRDHTERMLKGFGAEIRKDGLTSIIKPGELKAATIVIPGDISSAAFYLAAGAIIPDACITIKGAGINPTRTGIIEVLTMMGARIQVTNACEIAGEPIGDITVKTGELKGIEFGGEIIPRLVDEIPILAVVAALAEGQTIIRDAQELKVKESNRLQTTAQELRRFGVNIQETDDGLIIRGGRNYTGAVCESHDDHRIAMACTLMGLAAAGTTTIKNADCTDISFPGFAEAVANL
ncbi:MAG: 3-phosphoshikimate 1-carboxyvinyltransferase [Methylocystaceae bacterium]